MDTTPDTAVQLPGNSQPVLLFDGVCNLCNRFVQAAIRADKQRVFRYSSLQSGTGQQVTQYILQHSGSVPDSIILTYRGEYYTRSSAVLKAAQLLGGPWRLLSIGYLLPAFLRDGIYNFVAKNRYKWFGRKDTCMVPTPELKALFLD